MAIWQLAFRPFFLMASLLAVVLVDLWVAILSGLVSYRGFLVPQTWHAHEMLFGFAGGVVAGFVLTAVQNWSGKRGIHGPKLMGLVGLWILARVLLAFSKNVTLFCTAVDLAFFPLVCFFLFSYLKDPELKRERVFFVLFGLLFLGNALVHAGAWGFLHGQERTGILIGLYTIVTIIVFIGGRVIPFFTESSIAKIQPKTYPRIEILSPVSVLLLALTQLFSPSDILNAFVAFSTSIIHLVRLSGWYVRRVRRAPLLWVLHLGYLWMVLGFFLTGLASLKFILPTIAIHALTVGCIAIIILGMISRVSLGHTGRLLHPHVLITTAFAILGLAAMIRVFGPLLGMGFYLPALQLSAILWSFSYVIFFVIYWPVLTRPRVDGRAG